MYNIKQIPEDFVVKEILKFEPSEGNYGYYLLKKRDINTMKAVEIISEKLKIPINHIGFAGSKDRHAVCEQHISIKNIKKTSITHEKFKLTYIGECPSPLNLGDLTENGFEITVRNIEEKPEPIKFIPNYFDNQRFSKNNFDIGLAIIKKDFKKAASLMDNETVKNFLEATPNDPIGAIRLLPRRLALLYIHSFQSYVWNEVVGTMIKEKFDKHYEVNYYLGEMVFCDEKIMKNIELAGFGTEFEDEDVEESTSLLLADYDVTQRDFIINQIPELTSEGSIRSMFVDIKNLEISDLEDDELNENKKKCKIIFSLPKGSYATVVIKALFKE